MNQQQKQQDLQETTIDKLYQAAAIIKQLKEDLWLLKWTAAQERTVTRVAVGLNSLLTSLGEQQTKQTY